MVDVAIQALVAGAGAMRTRARACPTAETSTPAFVNRPVFGRSPDSCVVGGNADELTGIGTANELTTALESSCPNAGTYRRLDLVHLVSARA